MVILSLTHTLSLSIKADSLFKLLSPLVKDQADQPVDPPDPDDFEEEQMMMACLVDLFRAPEQDQQYLVSQAHYIHTYIHTYIHIRMFNVYQTLLELYGMDVVKVSLLFSVAQYIYTLPIVLEVL